MKGWSRATGRRRQSLDHYRGRRACFIHLPSRSRLEAQSEPLARVIPTRGRKSSILGRGGFRRRDDRGSKRGTVKNRLKFELTTPSKKREKLEPFRLARPRRGRLRFSREPAKIVGFSLSGRRDLNPRRPPWQGGTLPLSYSRDQPGTINPLRHPCQGSASAGHSGVVKPPRERRSRARAPNDRCDDAAGLGRTTPPLALPPMG
jgi:hypothetical protein